jgi:uncharacterized membrane protein
MFSARAVARLAAALAYPIGIYLALIWLEPRVVAAGLIAILVLRRRLYAERYLRSLSWVSRGILAALVLLCLGAFVQNDETLLRLYPAALSGAFLVVFGLSLLNPPTVVERIARLRNPELPAAGVRYTRQVTQIWCAFFVLNGLIAAWTAVWSSREVWALYTGFISYLAMGVLFAGEWVMRRRLFPEVR